MKTQTHKHTGNCFLLSTGGGPTSIKTLKFIMKNVEHIDFPVVTESVSYWGRDGEEGGRRTSSFVFYHRSKKRSTAFCVTLWREKSWVTQLTTCPSKLENNCMFIYSLIFFQSGRRTRCICEISNEVSTLMSTLCQSRAAGREPELNELYLGAAGEN